MNKNLKYIRITGILKSRGEYLTGSAEFRPYEAVTIVDDEGEEVHFHTLSIPKRIDEKLARNTPTTFYILRYHAQFKMIGILYAAETNGEKLFFPGIVIPALEALGMQATNRYGLIKTTQGSAYEVGVFAPVILVGGGAIAYGLNSVFGMDGTTAMFLGCLGVGFYMFSPLLFRARGAGIAEMYQIMRENGFSYPVKKSSSY